MIYLSFKPETGDFSSFFKIHLITILITSRESIRARIKTTLEGSGKSGQKVNVYKLVSHDNKTVN